MPIKKTAIKELRKAKKRIVRNAMFKRSLEFTVRKFKKAVAHKSLEQAQEQSKKIIKLLDKMAEKDIMKKNTASRKKSQIMKTVNKLVSSSK